MYYNLEQVYEPSFEPATSGFQSAQNQQISNHFKNKFAGWQNKLYYWFLSLKSCSIFIQTHVTLPKFTWIDPVVQVEARGHSDPAFLSLRGVASPCPIQSDLHRMCCDTESATWSFPMSLLQYKILQMSHKEITTEDGIFALKPGKWFNQPPLPILKTCLILRTECWLLLFSTK